MPTAPKAPSSPCARWACWGRGRRTVRPTSQRHLDLGSGTRGLDKGPASPRAPNSVIGIQLPGPGHVLALSLYVFL